MFCIAKTSVLELAQRQLAQLQVGDKLAAYRAGCQKWLVYSAYQTLDLVHARLHHQRVVVRDQHAPQEHVSADAVRLAQLASAHHQHVIWLHTVEKWRELVVHPQVHRLAVEPEQTEERDQRLQLPLPDLFERVGEGRAQSWSKAAHVLVFDCRPGFLGAPVPAPPRRTG